MTDTKELRRLAEAATNWRCDKYWQKEDEDGVIDGEWFVGTINEDGNKFPVAHIDGAQYFADEEGKQLAMYYASANPSAILSLLDKIDELEQKYSYLSEKYLDAACKYSALMDRHLNERESVGVKP